LKDKVNGMMRQKGWKIMERNGREGNVEKIRRARKDREKGDNADGDVSLYCIAYLAFA
jgi:hypothetical protein